MSCTKLKWSFFFFFFPGFESTFYILVFSELFSRLLYIFESFIYPVTLGEASFNHTTKLKTQKIYHVKKIKSEHPFVCCQRVLGCHLSFLS